MLVGGVIGDEVDDHPQTPAVCLVDHLVEVGERPEERVDIAVVRDVVAEVGHRRRVEGRDPERVDAEAVRLPAQMIEMRDQPAQIADAVARGVREAARVNLVEDRLRPPVGAHR